MQNNHHAIGCRSGDQVPINVQWVITLFIYLLGLITYGAFYFDSFFLDADSPWHLAAGDVIRSLENVPTHDPWSYTNTGVKWYNISWLYDVIISWIHSLVGLKGLIAVNVLVAALTPAVLSRISFRAGAGVVATLVACSIALIMLKSCFALRPQQFALFLVALMLLELYKFRFAQHAKLWLIPLLTLLLVNMHGSFLLVFAMLGAFWLEALSEKQWKQVKALTLVGVACVVATFVNPFTYNIYYASWLTLTSEIGKYHISEWQPAGLSTHPHIYFYALIALVVPFFYRICLLLADKLLLIFWVIMALNSARYNAVLSLFITPFIALFFSVITTQLPKLQHAENAIQSDLNQPKSIKALAIAIMVVMGFLLCPISRNAVWTKELYDSEKYPVKEIAYLMEHRNGQNILNHYNYGGYIIYQSAGTLKPFVDGRADTAYSKEFLDDYVDIEAFNFGWQKLLDKYDVGMALLPNDLNNIEVIQNAPGWEVIYKGPVASVYRKTELRR